MEHKTSNVVKRSNRIKKEYRIPRSGEPFAITEDMRRIYGGYFNLAMGDFYKTIMHIFSILGIKQTTERYSGKGELRERPLFTQDNLSLALRGIAKYLSDSKKADAVRKSFQSQLKLKVKKFNPESEQDKKQADLYDQTLTDLMASLNLTSEQKVQFQRLLFRHFPFMGPIMADVADYQIFSEIRKASEGINSNNERELRKKKSAVINSYEKMRSVTLTQCMEELCKISQCLTECRNFYTHFKPYNSNKSLKQQYEVQAAVAIKLDKILTASRRIDKRRVSISTEEMEFLTGADHFKEVDKKFIEREDFYFNPKGFRQIAGMTEPVPALSDFGITYFCLLFLSKSYGRLFLDETGLLNKTPFNEDENALMREILGVYRMRTPRGKRLDSQSDASALGMDMLNELRRCPAPLYDVLSQKGKRFFEDKVQRENGHTPEVVKRLRSEDRFSQLALRFLDEKQSLGDIRFQIRLGTFRYRFFDKVCIDGKKRVRRIQKDITGFGHLAEIETIRQEAWQDKLQHAEYKSVKQEYEEGNIDLLQFEKDSDRTQPYVTARRAEYNIHNNRIGLYWDLEENERLLTGKGLSYVPELITAENDGKRIAPVKMPAPLCSLSIRELPALVFYSLLQQKYNAVDGHNYLTADEIIKNKYSGLVKLFSDIRDGNYSRPADVKLKVHLKQSYSGLNLTDIPDKIRHYLMDGLSDTDPRQCLLERTVGKNGTLERMQEMLQRRLDTFEHDRRMIGDKQNAYGKKSYSDVRSGALAMFLTRDMVKWQASDRGGRNKITGLNFSVLRSSLSLFGQDIDFDALRGIIDNSGLTKGEHAHPFLGKVLSLHPVNIEQFYLFYLEEEIRTIKDLMTRKRNVDLLSEIPFVHPERVRYNQIDSGKSIQELAARYLTINDKDSSGNTVTHRAIIQLPDGLFISSINRLLMTEFRSNAALRKAIGSNDNPCDYKRSGKHNNSNKNAAFHIAKYFELILEDRNQPFYYSKKTDINPETLKTNYGPVDRFAREYLIFTMLRNKKKGPGFEPLYLSPDQINGFLSERALDSHGQEIPLTDPQTGIALSSEDGTPLFKKKISDRIESFIQDERSRRIRKAEEKKKTIKTEKLDSEDHELREQLARAVRFCKDNERTIRRYKTQDMVLFLMAKELLGGIMDKDKAEPGTFKLCNVCSEGFLRQTMRFEFKVRTAEGKQVSIVQPNMSIKNYGEFYRLLVDERFISLLERLRRVDTLNYNKLMGELTTYDRYRSVLFGIIHQVEESIMEKTKTDLSDETKEEFYVDNDFGNPPKRNNFRSLLSLLDSIDESELTQDECEILIMIRNAFSHNHYRIPFDEWIQEDNLKKYCDWMAAEDVPRENHPKNKRIAPPALADHILEKAKELEEKSGAKQD